MKSFNTSPATANRSLTTRLMAGLLAAVALTGCDEIKDGFPTLPTAPSDSEPPCQRNSYHRGISQEQITHLLGTGPTAQQMWENVKVGVAQHAAETLGQPFNSGDWEVGTSVSHPTPAGQAQAQDTADQLGKRATRELSVPNTVTNDTYEGDGGGTMHFYLVHCPGPDSDDQMH